MDLSKVDYLWIIVVFLSAVWHLILTAPIHCRLCGGSIVSKLCNAKCIQICSNEETSLHIGRPKAECSAFLFLGELFL